MKKQLAKIKELTSSKWYIFIILIFGLIATMGVWSGISQFPWRLLLVFCFIESIIASFIIFFHDRKNNKKSPTNPSGNNWSVLYDF